MRRLYTLLLYLLTPLVVLRLAWRSLRAPDYRYRWRERFGIIEPPLGKQVIWVHAVSVGEVNAAEPVIRALLDRFHEYSILITTVTPTGAARANTLFGSKIVHIYAPYDLPGVVARFIDRVRPQLAIVIETELWPNLFRACASRSIPLLLINARLSERSLNGYRKVRSLVSETLACVTTVAAQGKVDAERFLELGANPERVTVTGNLKFEQKIPPSLFESAEVLRREWGTGRPVWIAASTHEGEDELVLDVFRNVRKKIRDCLLVLVPRHPERFDAVAELCRYRGYETILRSERQPCMPETNVFVGDTMGELPLFYAASDVAFVGGSLVHHGGHNLLEPAALGIPVVTGPNVFNFVEVCGLLEEAGACVKIESTAELERVLLRWLNDANERHRIGQQGKQVVEANRGALGTVMTIIEHQLPG